MLLTISNKSISFKILKMKEKIDEFLDIDNLPKLNHEDIESRNRIA